MAWIGVDLLPVQRAAGTLQNQFRDTRTGGRSDPDIGAALEAVRGIGVHGVAARGLTDGSWVEPRRLDQHVLRAPGDHRVEATHDAGEGDRLVRIRNDQIFRRKLAVNTIERLQLFARARAANDDLATLKGVEIEAVRRVP